MEDENMPCDHVKAGKKCMPKCNPGFKVGLATIGSTARFSSLTYDSWVIFMTNVNRCFSYIEAVECYEKQHQQSAIVQKEGCVASVVYPCAFVILTIFIKSICTDSMRIIKYIPWIINLDVEFWVAGSKWIYPSWIFIYLNNTNTSSMSP